MIEEYINSFLLYFVMLDPIGLIPIFLGITHGLNEKDRKKIASSAIMYSCILAIFFIVFGWSLFKALGINSPAVGIGGGILLFIFSLEMLFEKRQQRRQKEGEAPIDVMHLAVFPMAMPLIIGPGAIIALVLRREKVDSLFSIASLMDILAIITVLFCIFITLHFSSKIQKVLKDRFMILLSRLMGLLLAILATQIALDAVSDFVKSF